MDLFLSGFVLLRRLCPVQLFVYLMVFVVAVGLPIFRAKAEIPAQTLERWPVCDSRSISQKVSFIHISDMHANYNPDAGGNSPVSRVRGYYEKVKEDNPFTVFTDSGDDYEKGSIAEELSHGRSTRQVVQAMGFDVRTLGNHDFSWGINELLRFSNDPKSVVLSTNTRIDRRLDSPIRDSPAGFTDFTVLTVGCLKIGFFGLTTKPFGVDGGQHEGSVYANLPALAMDFDFVAITNRIIAQYRQEVDVLVLVSHLGITDDINLAEQTNGIDLILGGHSHTTLAKPVRVKKTAIVHVGAHAEHIGRYDLFYDVQSKAVVDSRFQLVANSPGNIEADAGIDKAVATILQSYQQELTMPVTEVKWDQSQQDMALIAAHAAVKSLQIDAAFVSFASVWQEWQAGKLTRQDILDAFRVEREPVGTPGTSSLYTMEVTGTDLLRAKAILKNSAYWGPTDIDPTNIYTIALQKAQALNQQQIFAGTIGLAPPLPVAELWQVVVAMASEMSERNIALDKGGDNRLAANLTALLTGHGKANPAL